MPTYSVKIEGLVRYYTEIEIEADDPDSAASAAMDNLNLNDITLESFHTADTYDVTRIDEEDEDPLLEGQDI